MDFSSRQTYERFIYALPERYAQIRSSSLRLYTNSPTTCLVRGSIVLQNGTDPDSRVFATCVTTRVWISAFTKSSWWS